MPLPFCGDPVALRFSSRCFYDILILLAQRLDRITMRRSYENGVGSSAISSGLDTVNGVAATQLGSARWSGIAMQFGYGEWM